MTEANNALLAVVGLLAHKGISTSVESHNGALGATFNDGFYKSDGCASLCVIDGHLFLCARYDSKTPINGIEDIVRCSMGWYEYSRDRFDGWATPPAHWAALYAELAPVK